MKTTSIHGMWSSRMAFILAATGSAVGLGNIWRFPYITSENGGGAFVLVYLACILLMGLPLMLSEIMIGRRGRMSPVNSLKNLATESGSAKAWGGVGLIGIAAGFLILSFYSVVAGWTLYYAFHFFTQLFGASGIADPSATFAELLANPGRMTFWHGVFMVLTVGVVAMGVENGLERAVRVLMPLLFLLLLILLVYAATATDAFGQAVVFLFRPDFSRLDAGVVMTAMGQAFFTLSLGMGSIMTYGAYLSSQSSIPRVGLTVALADTGVALIAGLAIFPIVIAYGLSPEGGGPGLIFESLPLAFADMPFGIVYGLMFFLLLSVAAWTSSISLLEPGTAFFVEATRFSRRSVALVLAAVAWLAGLVSVLSLNVWQEVNVIGERNFMESAEYVANDIMLPLAGLFIAIFAGWVLSKTVSREELGERFPAWVYTGWLWLVRVATPLLILIVFAGKLGWF